MANPVLKYIAWVAGLGVVLYNSVYFKRLDEVKATGTTSHFDAVRVADEFWKNQLLPTTQKAPDLSTLIPLLKTDPEKVFTTYSNALGIGNIRYFLVKGQGRITEVGPDEVMMSIPAGTDQQEIRLATEFIYGNAVRDASGLIKIQEFDNTTDLDKLSAEINKIIRTRVVPDFKANARKGNEVKFIGAIELNKAHLNLNDIEVMPISVEVIQAQKTITPAVSEK